MPETKDQPPHQHSYLKQALLTAAVTTATFTGLYFLVEQRIQHIVDQKLAAAENRMTVELETAKKTAHDEYIPELRQEIHTILHEYEQRIPARLEQRLTTRMDQYVTEYSARAYNTNALKRTIREVLNDDEITDELAGRITDAMLRFPFQERRK